MAVWLTPNCRARALGLTPAASAARIALTLAFVMGVGPSFGSLELTVVALDLGDARTWSLVDGGFATGERRRSSSAVTVVASCFNSASDNALIADPRSAGRTWGTPDGETGRCSPCSVRDAAVSKRSGICSAERRDFAIGRIVARNPVACKAINETLAKLFRSVRAAISVRVRSSGEKSHQHR